MPFLSTGGLEPPAGVDPEGARRAADDILGRAEYQEVEQSLVDRAFEWLFERIADVLPGAPGGGPGSSLAWVFVVVLLAVALWLVIRALRATSRRRRDDDEPVLRYGTETTRDATVWRDEADRLAAAGDHRGALRCRHQALVAVLVQDGVVDDLAGRTAGEYRDLASVALPTEAERLARLTDTFDAVWYGARPVDAEAYGRFVSSCEAVEAAATAPAPATAGGAA